MHSLGNEIPSYAVSVVWERQEHLLLNKWFNCNPELFPTTLLLDVRYNLVPVARIEFRRIKGRGDGRRKDNDETVFGVFRKNSTTQREYDRDNQWDITSDGPDSTTSGSDIPEGHYDRPPEEEYSDIPTSGRPHVGYVAEGLCSPIRQLEKAVVWLQQDMTDYRTALRLRTQTPDSGLQTDSGLRRKKIWLYLKPDDHMIDM